MPDVNVPADNLANYADQVTGGAGIHPPSDAFPAYGERLGVGRGFIDPRPGINDSVQAFYTRSIALSADNLNQFSDAAFREQPIPATGYIHWITEELIGSKNGSNQNFTISNTPVVATMSVYMNGVRLVRVAGSPTPGEAQYGVSGTNVVLGQPPNVGQWVCTKYFCDF